MPQETQIKTFAFKKGLSWPFCLFTLCLLIYSFPNCWAFYERNPNVTEEQWSQLVPYFLPENSPQKALLDSIFKKKGVLKSEKSMRKAGFLLIAPENKIVVARHYKLRGFLVKAFLDHSSNNEIAELDEALNWKTRCDGAKILEESIIRHGYENIFKVPKKWIYPLPPTSSSTNRGKHRNFILLVEDMYVLSKYKNKKAYKEKMTPDILQALFILVKEHLLFDSLHPSNVPFCVDGKLAFIDTEVFNYRLIPLPWANLGYDLSKDMQKYWISLVENF